MNNKSHHRFGIRRGLMSSVCPIMGLAAGLILSNTAFAQTKIEQMIVTAQKRSQDVQQVPASISAFSGDTLQERQVRNLNDLVKATPNVNIGAGAAPYPIMSIRGVSADGSTPNLDQAVAVHIDGVYQPRTMGLWVSMNDLESVEVLRGPQGTLYGRNANAGVINLITKKPTDSFEASATIFGGSWGRYGARGYVSGPITEGISARLSAIVDRSSGYTDNLYNGDTLDAKKLWGTRLSVRLKPIDDVTVDIAVEHSDEHSTPTFGLVTGINPPQYGPNMDALVAGGFDTRFTREPWKIYNNWPDELHIKTNSATATINWDVLPNVSVKSITGYQQNWYHSVSDVDDMPVDFIYSEGGSASHTISQEFNISAKLWDRLDTVTGLYYMDDQINDGGVNNVFPVGNRNGVTGLINPANKNLNATNQIDQLTKSKAIFFDATYSFTEQLRLLAGIRRTWDERTTAQRIWTILPNPAGTFPTSLPNPFVLAGCGPTDLKPVQKWASTTGRLGVQYDFTPDITGYVQWQDGFKDGGYNSATCNDDYLPEQIYSWEFGLRTTLFDGTTTLNATYFDYRYSNMQVYRTVPSLVSAGNSVDNAGRSTITGFEIELNSYLTDDLKVDVNVGSLDARFGPGFLALNGFTNVATNLENYQLARAPRLSISAGLEYTMRIGDFGGLKSRGEYSYTGRQWFDIFNQERAKQDGYSVWNAIFTFTPDSCPNMQFQAYVRNIADKAYVVNGFASPTLINTRGSFGPPRTFGGEITAKF